MPSKRKRMKRRPSKKTDQEQIERGCNLLKKFIAEHPEIEPTLWAGAFCSILLSAYNASGMPYDLFVKEWDKIKHHYKPWFDK
jgi:hypothetical protein